MIPNIEINNTLFTLDFCYISKEVISQERLCHCNYLNILQDTDAGGVSNSRNQGKFEEIGVSVYSEWFKQTLN